MLYMVRHGQTDWNLGNRIQGQYDISLNGTGRIQARELAEKLARFNIEYIISSDLSRAVETAQIIGNKLKIGIDYDARLREYDFGRLTGLNRAQIEPSMVQMFLTNPVQFGAERLEDAFTRVGNFLKDVDYVKNTLVVTHGGILNFVMCYLEDKDNIKPTSYLYKCLHTKIHNASVLRMRDSESEITILKNTRFYKFSKSHPSK